MTTTENPKAEESSDPSYIDYELFLSPSFSAPSFANTLVLSTNNPTDSPLDLSTPLSRVLFDIQEVDSHIHTLTSTSALPLLSHTSSQTTASQHIVSELSSQVTALNDSYKRLEKEVIERHQAADEVRKVSERLWHTVRLGRSVGRALQLGRQLEVQMAEQQSRSAQAREDHRAMVRASNTILSTRALLAASGPGEEGEHLQKVHAIVALQRELINPADRSLHTKAAQLVREFSMSTLSAGGTATYAQTEDVKARTVSALQTLHLLSPQPSEWLVQALQDYLRSALTSSLASLTRALSALATLDRTLLEVSARCQNIAALELLLASTKPPVHSATAPPTLLVPVLIALETTSLPSHFWRSLAGALSPKAAEVVAKGGPAARGLRAHRAEVREAIREAVERGCVAPSGVARMKEEKQQGAWEREIAVMVGAVLGALGPAR